LESREHLLGEPKQGVWKEVVDLDIEPSKHLKRGLVRRQEAPERLCAPKQEQRSRADLGIMSKESESAGNLAVRQ